MNEDEAFQELSIKQDKGTTPHKDTLKLTILANLQKVKDDCDNFRDWDPKDRTNFEAMGSIIEDAIDYIERDCN